MEQPDINDDPNRPSRIDTQRTLHGHPGQSVARGDIFQQLPPEYEQVADDLMHYKNQAISFIQENPGVAVVGALGIGYVVGKFIGKFS